MKMKKTITAFASVLALTSINAEAKTLWSDNSISLLYGSTFEGAEEDKKKVTLTLEHASGHSWGDVFFFMDRLRATEGDNNSEVWSELHPRFSIPKLTGMDWDSGLIKDFYLSTQIEMGSNKNVNQTNYLVGAGVDFDVPGFKFLKVNAYGRSNENYDSNYQVSPAWAVPFDLANQKFLFDGWIDWVSKTKNNGADVASNWQTHLQLKYDLGNLWGSEHTVYVGTEYRYWHNKFGVSGWNERVWQGLIKVHL